MASRITTLLLPAAYLLLTSSVLSDQALARQPHHPDWQRIPVQVRAGNGAHIRAIYYPDDKPRPPLHQRSQRITPARRQVPLNQIPAALQPAAAGTPLASANINVNVIDSPPVAGFVPWVGLTLTNKRAGELETTAVPRDYLSGTALQGTSLETGFAIGLFDTGAAAHVIGYSNAERAGLYGSGNYLTNSTTGLQGASGIRDVWVSKPIGVYIQSLAGVDPNGATLLNTSDVYGETNTSILVDQGDPEYPELATALGAPLAVFFTAQIHNNYRHTVVRNGQVYLAPPIDFHYPSPSTAQIYPNTVTLELRPGDISVDYFPNVLTDPFDPDWGEPLLPSLIGGANLSQSLFFVGSVNLAHQTHQVSNSDNFMLDTGAQITVVGSIVADSLGLNAANPDFEVEIQDVTGNISMAPGFYVDQMDIPGSPEWLSFTNVPVVRLDIGSPEGGFLDGIIGMNLLTQYNLAFVGAGFSTTVPPRLEFEPIPYRLPADVHPDATGDGAVDLSDLQTFAEAYLAPPGSANWNWRCDLAPADEPDNQVNLLDFAAFAAFWLETLTP